MIDLGIIYEKNIITWQSITVTAAFRSKVRHLPSTFSAILLYFATFLRSDSSESIDVPTNNPKITNNSNALNLFL